MSIDNITLSTGIRNRLYKNSITNLNKPVQKKAVAVPYEGNNKKHILIAFDGKLSKQDRSLLDNLMSACKITMEEIALLNYREQEAGMREIVSQLKPQKGIFFGIPALGIDLPLGEEEEMIFEYDHCSFLKTAPLNALHQNVEKKKALWSALKKMFDL